MVSRAPLQSCDGVEHSTRAPALGGINALLQHEGIFEAAASRSGRSAREHAGKRSSGPVHCDL